MQRRSSNRHFMYSQWRDLERNTFNFTPKIYSGGITNCGRLNSKILIWTMGWGLIFACVQFKIQIQK